METTYQFNDKKIIFKNQSASSTNAKLLGVLLAVIVGLVAWQVFTYLAALKAITTIEIMKLTFALIAVVFVTMIGLVKPLLWPIYGIEQIYFGKDFLVHRVDYGWFKSKRRIHKLYSECVFKAEPASFMVFGESKEDSILGISTERTSFQTKTRLSNEEMNKVVREIRTWYATTIIA